MTSAACHLPCPSFTVRIPVPDDPSQDIDWLAIPSRAGVYAMRDDSGGTIALAATADLRRQLRSRLDPASAARRDHELRLATRSIDAVTVGSAFEADWAYLQLARRLTPATYTHVCDRWRAWFIHCDPNSEHPRFVKTHTPRPLDTAGAWFGPLGDRSSAQRVIEIVEDLFDLCRYYEVLVEAPNGRPCAYKEMGRCTAPCDGTVGLDVYREAMREAAMFLGGPIHDARERMETKMRAASAALDYEGAARHQRRWERSAALARPDLRWLAPLDRFRYLTVGPGEATDTARLIVVNGGLIEPWADLPIAADEQTVEDVITALRLHAHTRPIDLTPHGLENIGLCTWHLINGDAQEWLPLEAATAAQVRERLAKLSKV